MGHCCSKDAALFKPHLHDFSTKMEEFHSRFERLSEAVRDTSVHTLVPAPRSLEFKSTPAVRSRLHEYIRTNNLEGVIQLISERRISVAEEIGREGNYWTALHFACHFERANILKYLLEEVWRHTNGEAAQVQELLALVSYEGWTPAMVACVYDSVQSLRVLAEFGGLILNTRSTQNLTARELAEYFMSWRCTEFLDTLDEKKVAVLAPPPPPPPPPPAPAPATALLQAENSQKLPNSDRILMQHRESLQGATLFASAIESQALLSHKPQQNNYTSISMQYSQPNAGAYSLEDNAQNSNSNQQYSIEHYLKERTVSNARALLKQCRERNTNFVDEEFPHSLASIYDFQTEHENISAFRNARWLRVSEIFAPRGQAVELLDNIAPDTVRQGSLGVCYLLALLSAIAENVTWVQNLFNNKRLNPYGVYSVTLYVDGRPEEVLVDDYFPCHADRDEPLFARAHRLGLWAMFLEKAWAKTFRNYVNSERLLVEHAMEELLAAPAQGFWVSNFEVEELRQLLLQFRTHQFLVVATTNFELRERGDLLRSGHAYTLLNLNEKRVQLRDPWGTTASSQTDDVAVDSQTRLEHSVIELDYAEFARKFQYISVSYVRTGWHYASVHWEAHRHKARYALLELTQEGFASVRLHQPLKRRSGLPYAKSELRLMRIRSSGRVEIVAQGHLLFAHYGNKSVPVSDEPFLHLPAGRYVIRAKLFAERAVTLSCYSEHLATIELLARDVGKQVMKEYYIARVKQMKFELHREPNYFLAQEWDDRYRMIFALQNRERATCAWRSRLTLQACAANANIKFSGKATHITSESVEVRPFHTEIIVLKPVDLLLETQFIWQIESEYFDYLNDEETPKITKNENLVPKQDTPQKDKHSKIVPDSSSKAVESPTKK